MKLSENDVPKSIFFDLVFEYFRLRFSEPNPVPIFFDNFFSIPFSDPVSEIISDHSSEDSTHDRKYNMSFSPKSPYKYHHIHSWHGSSDDGKWFDTGWEKSDKVIPVANLSHEIPNPYNPFFYPLRMGKRDKYEDKCQKSERYRDNFREENKESFEMLTHSPYTMKIFAFRKGKTRVSSE